jgi:hypothetical protein
VQDVLGAKCGCKKEKTKRKEAQRFSRLDEFSKGSPGFQTYPQSDTGISFQKLGHDPMRASLGTKNETMMVN